MRSIPAILRHPAMLVAAVSLLVTIAARAYAPATDPHTRPVRDCPIPAELARFEHPLPRLAQRLAADEAVTIVAIGSSSTFGEGASSPDASYPSRLARELAQRFPQGRITILNRGISGDTDRDMRDRFERDVLAEWPDLVIWQLGTNSMLNGEPIDLSLMRNDVQYLRRTGADVVLLDPQYAPAVTDGGQAGAVVELIAQAARGTNVNLFRRFELMRRWREVERMTFDAFLSEDEFHMNDWSYACVARAMGEAMAEAATRPVQTAAR